MRQIAHSVTGCIMNNIDRYGVRDSIRRFLRESILGFAERPIGSRIVSRNDKLHIVILGLLLAISPVSSHAFDGKRHAEICLATLQNLNRPALYLVEQALFPQQATATSSLAKGFTQACRWPDKIKKTWRHRNTRSWHYLNVERADQTIPKDACRHQECVTQQLADYWQTLEEQARDNRVEYDSLAFVGHFIADLHQPLHISYGDDAGGNRRRIWWQPPLMKQLLETNLHSYWDGQLLDQESSKTPKRTLQPIDCQQYCPTQYPTSRRAKQVLIEQWANQSLAITQQIYQDLDPLQKKPQPLPMKIQQKWRNLLIQQQQIAAQRFSWLLNKTAIAAQ